MIIGVLKEAHPETRVALLPEHISFFKKLNIEVQVEQGAGISAFADDAAYQAAGAAVCSRTELLQSSDLLLCIHPISMTDADQMQGKVLLGQLQALFQASYIQELAKRNITVFSMEMLPRTTRAQSMDVLSSQANIAGYKAVLLAANLYSRYFPMFMTAAGSIPPVKILILGAGVAGLQAIATARRLGAVVEVFDTRQAVKEEVMSLGAKFVEVEGAKDSAAAGGYAVEQTEEFLQKQKARIAESVSKSDIIITTAQIPGKKAPVLITKEMIETMRNGSVIIDLAASTGGNTDLTQNDSTVMHQGVAIVGNSALPSTMPSDASKLYGKNLINFLQLMISKEGLLNINMDDDLVKGTCVATAGNITNERIAAALKN